MYLKLCTCDARGEGANDVHVQEVAAVRGLVELLPLCARRLALAVTQSSQEAWPAFAREAGASVVLATSFLRRSRPTWKRRCRTAGAWSGDRESTWELARPLHVRAGLVPRQERGVAAAAVTGGGAALAISRYVARQLGR